MADVFRKDFKELSALTKDHILIIKDKAELLLNEFDSISMNTTIDQRAMTLAKTNLEQAVMWAVKAIT
jgi:hypothetical protein